ncbi:hypothetical protein T4D_7013 [Trichinella pseudospiralis]|uniref:TATA box-binding protein-associated factor RNA polymerase I subunit B n=1 Tax=Trichinella pseudospiralis TaxID=6337 RepID=A0A0V1G2T2_TRIPS|nr:hypothetical protein T4D_7013 [Trichinella pseudospiralis]
MYSCSQCDCSEFDIVDGYYFCVSCGAQSQYSEQHMNNEDEDASLFMDVSSSDSKSKVEDHVKFTPEQLMLNAYTKVMQLQADALIACGFPESVKTAICILWFDYSSVRVLFCWILKGQRSELFKAAVFVLRQISFDTDTQWSNFCPKFRSDRPKIPLETQVMAVLIVVLKLLFGLNDQHELYGFVNLYIEEFKFLTLTNMILSSLADDNEVEGGNFSLLQWLLHNELKTAILKGQPVEEVLGLRWSDASRKVTNILEKLRRPSAVQRTENFFNPVLCPIFREVSSTADELLVSLPPVCFLMKTLPLYLAESVSKSRTPLDSSNVVLFGIDFSKKKTAFSSATWTSRSEFPFWNESYCRYPQIPATHRDSSAFAFNQMCFRLFSSTFYRLLALCCSYINERDKVLFKAVQMIEKCLFQDMKHVSSKWQLQ